MTKDDLIDRQAALKKLAVYIHLIDKTMGKGLLTDDDCMEAAKSVLGEDELPAVQPATNCSEIPNKSDTISRQAAIDAIMGQPPEPHYPSWYAAQIEKIPAVQSDHTADISKKAEGDCISRKTALDALAKQMPRSYTPDGSHPADEEIFRAQEVFADCIEALEILPSAQPESHWIPCSARLPEERGFYLTTTKDKAVYCDHWNEDNFGRTEMVIAWMPLPEPYQGGGKE